MNHSQITGQELEWRQSSMLQRSYDLTHKEHAIASLRFENIFGTKATGQYAEEIWTFKRTGFLSPKVSVRAAGSDADIAVFTPGWTGSGWVEFGSGPRYQLRHTNFWGTEWSFEAADGATMLKLTGNHGLMKMGAKAEITPAAAALPELPVLLLLIWYVRVLVHADMAGGAVVAAG